MGPSRAWQHGQTAIYTARLILLILCLDGLRAAPEEKKGLVKNMEHGGVGQLGRRFTSTQAMRVSPSG